MTYHQLAALIVKELTPIYGDREAVALQRYLFTALTGHTITELLPKYREEVGDQLVEAVNRSIGLLKEQVPVQYIIGKAWFCDLELEVNPSVLIPRPETEEMVMKIVNETDKNEPYRILDIGTGSGAIAIALAAHLPNAIVTAIDISQHALDTAAANAHKNKVKVDFMKTDILQWDPAKASSPNQSTNGSLNQQLHEQPKEQHTKHSYDQLTNDKFDLIVSNPPYVKRSEMEIMPSNVTLHEPHLALFVDDADPLLYYRSIVNFAHHNLQPAGNLWLEINESEGPNMLELFIGTGFEHIALLEDMSGKHRFIRAANYLHPRR